MRTLPDIRLTDNQKRVLAKVIAAPTPKVGLEEISTKQGFLAARDLLVRLNLLSLDNGGASVTDQGKQIMQDEALLDPGGQLTPDGEQLAHTDEMGKPEEDKAASPAPTDMSGAPLPPPGGPPGAPPPPGGELGGLPPPPGGDMGGGMPPLPQLQSDNYQRFKTLKTLLEFKKVRSKTDRLALKKLIKR